MLLTLDLTGSNPDNILVHYHHIKGVADAFRGEVITLPHGAFHQTVILSHNDTPLVLGTDYVLGHRLPELKALYDVDAFLSLVLINPKLTGAIKVTAKFLGDKYCFYGTHNMPEGISIVEAASSELAWAGLIEIPEAFLPGAHDIDGADITYGNQSLAQILWQTLQSKTAASDEAINNVLRMFLKDHQLKLDPNINGEEKDVVTAINQLYKGSSALYGINVKLDYRGVIKTTWNVPAGNGSGYVLIGDEVSVTGIWESGQGAVTRTVQAGRVLRFTVTGEVEDITELAGPYFRAYQAAYMHFNRPTQVITYLNDALDAINTKPRKSSFWIDSETDLTAFTAVEKCWFYVHKAVGVRGLWNGSDTPSTIQFSAKRIFSYTPGYGLGEWQEAEANHRQGGVLGIVEPELNTTNKSIDGALAEVSSALGTQGLGTGDMVMTARGHVGAPAPGLLQIASEVDGDGNDDRPYYSKDTYADLFGVLGTKYGESGDKTGFRLPKIPGVPPTDFAYAEGPGSNMGYGMVRGEHPAGDANHIIGISDIGTELWFYEFQMEPRTNALLGQVPYTGYTDWKFAGYLGEIGNVGDGRIAYVAGVKNGEVWLVEVNIDKKTLTDKYHFVFADGKLDKGWDVAWDGYFFQESGAGCWMICSTHIVRWDSAGAYFYKTDQDYGTIRHLQFDHRKLMWATDKGIWWVDTQNDVEYQLDNFYDADYLMWHRKDNAVIGQSTDQTKPTVYWVPGSTPTTQKSLLWPAWYNIQNDKVYSLEQNTKRFMQELVEVNRFQYWIQA